MLDDALDEPISLYFWPTPDGFKISIMLEELRAPYRVTFVETDKDAPLEPGFLAVSPDHRIPAIIDPDGPDGQPLALAEADAILHYLARKFDAFYPMSERAKAEVDQWLFWQSGALGPLAMQCLHYRNHAPEKIPYAIDHSTQEISRLFGVLERRLDSRDYLAGGYSIADIASFPWVRFWPELGQEIVHFPKVARWLSRVGERPAVAKGLSIEISGKARKRA